MGKKLPALAGSSSPFEGGTWTPQHCLSCHCCRRRRPLGAGAKAPWKSTCRTPAAHVRRSRQTHRADGRACSSLPRCGRESPSPEVPRSRGPPPAHVCSPDPAVRSPPREAHGTAGVTSTPGEHLPSGLLPKMRVSLGPDAPAAWSETDQPSACAAVSKSRLGPKPDSPFFFFFFWPFS